MGFLTPTPPPFDVQEWKQKSHLDRVKPVAQDWAANGFGTPDAVYLIYIVKIALYAVLGLVIIGATTPGLGGLGDFGDWWTEPIVWQKIVAWTIIWEMIGLGSAMGPLTFRFMPPIGSSLYWLRPGTVRLPPWPDKIPGTKGSARTPLDVALYAGVVGMAIYLLVAGETDAVGGFAGRLDPTAIGVMLGLWLLLGLRDKVPFLAGRPELYGILMVVFMFPLENMVVASQFVLFFIWFWAATSKLTHHFTNVVAVMVSNTPWNRFPAIKKRLYRNHPEDLRPSRQATYFAHLGTFIEFFFPMLLLFSQGGTLGWIAVAGMVVFHIHITSTFPLAVPLEWNLFMIFGAIFLFGHYGDVPLNTLDDPLLIAIMAVVLVFVPFLGNTRPDLIAFLPAMRYYAGNWATTQWLFSKAADAEETLDKNLVKPAPVVVKQLTTLYDEDAAELTLCKALAFRALHNHGRALNGLLFRAVDNLDDYTVREGEFLAGALIGWNFGDGHWHGKQLLDVVQEKCNFAPGELRVVTMESQPIQEQRQQYKIYDAATGLIEEGYVQVSDMMERQPWLDPTGEFPVQVIGRGAAAPAPEPEPPKAAAHVT
jgi:hypothetical protein